MNNTVSVISSLIIFLFPYVGKHWFHRNVLASTVVSLGLLGTFGGIFWGLLDFDVNNIEMSLPQLLEGLKTAFLTSIAGMASSLVLRLSPVLYGIKTEDNTAKEDSETKQLFELLGNIEKNTASTSSQSFTKEISGLRADNAQHFTMLNESLLNMITRLEELCSGMQKDWEAGMNDKLTTALENINASLADLHQAQTENTGQISTVLHELQSLLENLNQTSGKMGAYLNKSVSMSMNQQENMSNQMVHLGELVKTTGTQFEQQLVSMEEKFTRELSAMEQFTKTLVSIIKKLSQDHTALNKQQESNGTERN